MYISIVWTSSFVSPRVSVVHLEMMATPVIEVLQGSKALREVQDFQAKEDKL